jgi:probable F420-dependent oxidoreductase
VAEHQQKLGKVGAWTGSFQWPDDPRAVADAAAELESLGFGAVWIGLSYGALALHAAILAATSRLVVASATINVCTEPATTGAANYRRVAESNPGRLLLGLGASHASMVEAQTGQPYTRPLAKVASYLDDLDATEPPVPSDAQFLAALGPKSLELKADNFLRRLGRATDHLLASHFREGREGPSEPVLNL